MLPRQLNAWMAEEGEKINDVLRKELAFLPHAAQPIARHILMAGGKRLRPLLTVLFARLFGNKEEEVYRLAGSMEMLHAATLLHDDVLDNAEKRRGKPAAHTVYNIITTILGGDALLAHGNSIVASYNKPDLVKCFSRATVNTAAGEILEMESLRDPYLALQKYVEIARGKTACLIAESCAMGALAAGADGEQAEKCAAFGENLGIGFQIVDDALDFAPQGQTGKPQGGDLREGKMTPPLFFYRQSLDEKQREEFDSAFSRSGFSGEQVAALCQACAPFIEPAIALANDYLKKAGEILVGLPEGPQKTILAQLIDYVRERSN